MRMDLLLVLNGSILILIVLMIFCAICKDEISILVIVGIFSIILVIYFQYSSYFEILAPFSHLVFRILGIFLAIMIIINIVQILLNV